MSDTKNFQHVAENLKKICQVKIKKTGGILTPQPLD